MIEQMPGCLSLHLFHDTNHKTALITYSCWQSEDDLNAYRQSDLFKNTWKSIKPWLVSKPTAWSMKSF